MSQRIGEIHRKTGETDIRVHLDLEGSGQATVRTGVGFLDHMLQLLSHHADIDLDVEAGGDLVVDEHHTVEDVGISIGQALSKALGDKAGIERYGSVLLPMDEVLVAAAVDLSGRFTFVSNYAPSRDTVGDLSTEMVRHFFSSLALESRMNLHLHFLEPGTNEHHRVEAMFKGLARALRVAVARSEGSKGVPSTKGVL